MVLLCLVFILAGWAIIRRHPSHSPVFVSAATQGESDVKSQESTSHSSQSGSHAQTATTDGRRPSAGKIDLSFQALLTQAPSWAKMMGQLFPGRPEVQKAWHECLANYRSEEPKCNKILQLMRADLNWHRENGQLSPEEADFYTKLNLFECQRDAALPAGHGKPCEIDQELIKSSGLAPQFGNSIAEICRGQDPGLCFQATLFMNDDKLKNSYARYGCQQGQADACELFSSTTADTDPAAGALFLNACHSGSDAGCNRTIASVMTAAIENPSPEAMAPIQDLIKNCVQGQNSSACGALNSSGLLSSLNPDVQSAILNTSCTQLDLQSCVSLWQAQGITQSAQIPNRTALCGKYYKNAPPEIGSDQICQDGFCYSAETEKFFSQLCI
jgi:hypothetical protein